MVAFTAKIQKFGSKGEKTGWSYIEVSKTISEKINPGCRKTYRVRGQLDLHKVSQLALLPMGNGNFIIPMNSALRKGTGKTVGDSVKVSIELEEKPKSLSKDLVACLKDEAAAYTFFKTLPRGHQQYFSNWIDSAKTAGTKTKRITMAVMALAAGKGFGEMIRENKKLQR